MKTFKSGAKRSDVSPRYDLIPRSGLYRLARRYTEGAAKYGEWNWQKGLNDKEFIDQVKCHIMEHLLDYFANGCKKDDNLAAAAWGLMTLMEAEAQNAKERTERHNDCDSRGSHTTRPPINVRSRKVRRNPR